MSLQPPFKILEINVISAQDLPSVSKMLRTFAVAYLHPDHKLTTTVDHHGKTNPTWNYRLVFCVDDAFLKSEAAMVTFEIYNVAWLRDLPIGTTQLMINSFSPPLSPNNPTMRSTALHIRRPSGHLQGILNVGVQLIDTSPPEMYSASEFSASICASRVSSSLHEKNDPEEEESEKNCMEEKEEEEAKSQTKGILLRSESKRKMSKNSDSSPNQKAWRTPTVSFCSGVQPIPSEVAEDMKKALYYTGEGVEYGSSIFENWTTTNTDRHNDDDLQSMRSKSLTWGTTDEQKHMQDCVVDMKKKSKRRHHSDGGGGLFSCFGKAFCFEFKFICGSPRNSKKERAKKIEYHKTFPYNHSEENLRKFYV